MALLDAHQVADYWTSEGGPVSRVVEWVSISMAESSFDTQALSVTSARGLWQEEPDHAAEYGYTVEQLYDPSVNAFIAVRLSGYGQNCAAWDTAYANINASGRYSFLGFPERGSAAWNNLATVANLLGRNPQYPGPGNPPAALGNELPAALQRWASIADAQLPSLGRQLGHQRARLDRAYVGR